MKEVQTTQENDDQNTPAEETDDTSTPEATTTTFTGDAVVAQLPTNWTITEYYNGQGSDMLVDGVTYTGLTGLKIFENGTQMFWLKAVNGIGFAGCSEYYAFEDDNPAYRQEMQNIADEIGDSMHINNFSSMPYYEYTWLGHTTRRVANRFFQDETEGNAYFEASCFNALVLLNGVSFKDGDNHEYSGYFYEFPSGITGDQLLQVDNILKSMSVVE
jgi:hypothetical protein